MNNVASLLILIFMAVTFIQSAQDKIFSWKDNLDWLRGVFENTVLKNIIPFSLMFILVIELITGVLCLSGCAEILINGGRTFGFWGAVFSCITLIFLLLGQRIAKDYDGARTIAIYFIPAVLAVYWLS